MIFAIGVIGEQPRIFIECPRADLATSQVRPGEICLEVAERPNGGTMTATGVEPGKEGD